MVALANKPYDLAIPVREAELVDLSEDESFLGLELALGQIVEPDIDGFSAAVAQIARPGSAFVGPFPSGFATGVASDPAAAWARIVDELKKHPDYEQSAFLRLHGIEIDGLFVPADRLNEVVLTAASDLTILVESRNDHLDAADLARTHLFGDAQSWSVETDEALPAAGLVRFPIRVEAEDRPRLGLRLGVRPGWADSSVVEIDVAVVDQFETMVVPVVADSTPAEAPSRPERASAEDVTAQAEPSFAPVLDPHATAIRPQDAHRLLEALKRDGVTVSLGLLEEHLLRWFPGDARLEEERIRLLFDAGDEAAASRRLAELPPPVQGRIDPWLRFRGAVVRSESDAAAGALEEVSDYSPDRLDLLVDGLTRMGPSAVGPVLDRLADRLLGERTLSDLLERLDPAEMDPQLVLKVADITEAVLSQLDALSVLQRRLRVAFDVDLARRAADLASSLDGRQPLDDWVGDLVEADLRRGDGDGAVRHLTSLLADLGFEQKLRLVIDTAAHLRPLDALVPTIQVVSRDAIAASRFDAVAALVGLLAEAGQDEIGSIVREDLEKALRETEIVRQYLDTLYENRLARTADWIAGRELIVVGGPKEQPDVVAHLTTAFRVGKVRWLPCEKNKRPSLAALDGAHKDSHIVVILVGHVGHSVSEPAEQACRRRDVTYVKATTEGAEGIARALVDRIAPLQ